MNVSLSALVGMRGRPDGEAPIRLSTRWTQQQCNAMPLSLTLLLLVANFFLDQDGFSNRIVSMALRSTQHCEYQIGEAAVFVRHVEFGRTVEEKYQRRMSNESTLKTLWKALLRTMLGVPIDYPVPNPRGTTEWKKLYNLRVT